MLTTNTIGPYKYTQGFYRHLKLCGVRKERESFQCTACFKSFEFRCRLKNHMNTACKLNAPVNTGKQHDHTCFLCNKHFKTIQILQNHTSLCYSGDNINDSFIPSLALSDLSRFSCDMQNKSPLSSSPVVNNVNEFPGDIHDIFSESMVTDYVNYTDHTEPSISDQLTTTESSANITEIDFSYFTS